MHISILLGALLGLTIARPNPYEDSRTLLSTITDQAATVGHRSFPESTTTLSSSQGQIVSRSIQNTDIMTRTQLTTITHTSFMPVSTLVTQSGSIVYYSTWLSVIYPTSVVTSTEYITGGILTVTKTSVETVSLRITPSMTYECICPPITETVYIFATIGPIMTVTSDSTFFDQQTVVATLPTATITSATFLPISTASPSTTLIVVSSSNENGPIQSSTPTSSTIQTASTMYGNSTLTGNSTGLLRLPMVSQMPNGQLVIPLVA